MISDNDFPGREEKKERLEKENDILLAGIIETNEKVASLLRKSSSIQSKSPGTIEMTHDSIIMDGRKILSRAYQEFVRLGGEQKLGKWRLYATYQFLCYVDDMLRIYQIAERVYYSSCPDIVRNEYEIGDLVSQAYIGLVEARERYERTDQGWRSCSGLRIKGSIIDSFYKQLSHGEISKRQMRLKRDIDRVKENICKAKGEASPADIAGALGIQEDDVHLLLGRLFQVSSLSSLTGSAERSADDCSGAHLPAEIKTEVEEMAERVNTCLNKLGSTVRRILNLMYVHGYKQNAIGRLIDIPLDRIYIMTRNGKKELLACLEQQGLRDGFELLLTHHRHVDLGLE